MESRIHEEYVIIQIVEEIKDNLEEVIQDKEKNDLTFGKLLANIETLSAVRRAIMVEEQEKYGLDFDFDGYYINKYDQNR